MLRATERDDLRGRAKLHVPDDCKRTRIVKLRTDKEACTEPGSEHAGVEMS